MREGRIMVSTVLIVWAFCLRAQSTFAECNASSVTLCYESKDFVVMKSRLVGAGHGCFANRAFQKEELLGTFKCVNVSKTLHSTEHDRSWSINKTHTCDGSRVPLNNPLLYVNSIAAEATCNLQNVKMDRLSSGEVVYVAIKEISRGEELLVDYGSLFFKMRRNDGQSGRVVYECHMSRLSVASARGDVSLVTRLLREGSDANTEGNDGWTPIMEASAGDHAEVVELLLRHNAKVDKVDKANQSALYIAAKLGNFDTVDILMKANGITVDALVHGEVPFVVATESDDSPGIWVLPTAPDSDGDEGVWMR
jgi:hypothetical protein